MISDSAWVSSEQLWPALSSAVDMTAKPRPSASVGLPPAPAVSPVTLGAEPDWWSIPQLAPWVISSLWFHCSCGAHALQSLPGWKSVAIWYWSRSW